MARTTITPSAIAIAGVDEPAGTAGTADGHQIAITHSPYSMMLIRVIQSSGGPLDLTITAPSGVSIDGVPITNKTISCTSGTAKYVGPFTKRWDSGSNLVYINFAAASEAEFNLKAFTLTAP